MKGAEMNRINEMNAQELRVEIAKERGYTAELDKNVRKRNSGIDRYPQNQRYRPRRTWRIIAHITITPRLSAYRRAITNIVLVYQPAHGHQLA
jgi:hypothetical protein